MQASGGTGHSTTVRLGLEVGDRQLPLASIGPTFVVLAQRQALPAGEARIVMEVDGESRSWPVELPDGAVPFDDVVRICDLD